MPPVLLGIAIIGGAIVLITSAFSDEDESANKNNEEGKLPSTLKKFADFVDS